MIEVHIGAAGSGVEELGKAGAPAKGQSAAGGEAQSFKAQLQAMQAVVGTPVAKTPVAKTPAPATAAPVKIASASAGPSRQLASTRSASAETQAPKEPGAKPSLPEVAAHPEPAQIGSVPKTAAPVPAAAGDGKVRSAPSPLRAGTVEPPASPVVEAADSASAASIEESAAPKKASSAPEKGGAIHPKNAGSQVEAQATAVPEAAQPISVAAARLPQPATVPVAKVAVGSTTAPLIGARIPAGRGHEAKKPVAASHGAASGDAKAVAVGATSADATIGVTTGVTTGSFEGSAPALLGFAQASAGAVGVTGLGVSGIAAGPVLAVSLAAIPPTASATGAGGVSSAEQQAASGLGFHGEVETPGAFAAGEPRMLVATPNALEVGVAGGAHGWLRVRAELEHTGEVTASLVASSAASADALHKELGAMSAYLKSEAVGVSSLAVAAVEKSGAAQGAGGSTASTGGAGAQGGTGGGARSGPDRESGEGDPKPAAWSGLSEAANVFGPGYGNRSVSAALLGVGIGGWLNVRV